MRIRKRLFLVVLLGATVCSFIHFSLQLFKPQIKTFRQGNVPYYSNRSAFTLKNSDVKSIAVKPLHTSEIRHIAFLKVHKAASSTVQNIFLRFGYSRHLNFVLPAIPSLSWPNVISVAESLNSYNIMSCPPGKSFDILCCHVIFDKEAFRKYMPNDTTYIGIVRDPFQHFQSSLYYFLPKYIFNIKAKFPVSEYLRQPYNYEYRNISPKYVFTNNRMAVEFGFPDKLFVTRNIQEIKQYLEELSNIFSLVIVVEYLDESILLMKHILNWSIKDILYVSKNSAGKKILRQPDDLRNLQEWSTLDYALYDYFHTRLWRQISSLGPSFQRELLYFKRLRLRITDFCNLTNHTHTLVVSPSKWNDRFIIDSLDCRMMMYDELSFLEKIRRKQYNITTKYLYSYKQGVQKYYEKNEKWIEKRLEK